MADLDSLFQAARAAREKAYAPYSRFKVGAAIRTPSGAIHSGVNVENAAYPQGQCAEASAIASMVLSGEHRIAEILVVGDGEALVTPCPKTSALRRFALARREAAPARPPAVGVFKPRQIR